MRRVGPLASAAPAPQRRRRPFSTRIAAHAVRDSLLEQVVNGLVLGGYYLLIALGLSLIFSVGGVVNLAHGAFYALGAYVSVEITKYLGFGPAVVLSPVAVGAARHPVRALHPAPLLRPPIRS